ncbi:MAG: flagellar biosynthesis protein FliQ [Chromatiales bacterium]|nr:flagellar biosynthesis protein FliQ [Chromatiales bacterium]
MDAEAVITVGREALEVTVLLAGPILGAALIIGLLIGMIQAATQINEMTLSFVPKLAVVVVVLLLVGPWMLNLIMEFTIRLMENIPHIIG